MRNRGKMKLRRMSHVFIAWAECDPLLLPIPREDFVWMHHQESGVKDVMS